MTRTRVFPGATCFVQQGAAPGNLFLAASVNFSRVRLGNKSPRLFVLLGEKCEFRGQRTARPRPGGSYLRGPAGGSNWHLRDFLWYNIQRIRFRTGAKRRANHVQDMRLPEQEEKNEDDEEKEKVSLPIQL